MWRSGLRIWALVKKELLAVLKDPRSRYSLFLPPILQCLIFGYAASYDLNDVPYAVFDEDRSIASNDLLLQLDASRRVSPRRKSRPRTRHRESGQRQGCAACRADRPGFRAQSGCPGMPADVQVIADGRNSNTAGMAICYVGSIVDAFNANWRKSHAQSGGSLQVVWRAWYNPNLETRWNMIPSLIGTITLMQTMMLAAMSVAREREEGTFDQLLVTPFRPMEIMAGKALPAMLVGLVQATNILLVALLWFHIPFRVRSLTLYAGLMLFLLAAVGIGIFVSSFAAIDAAGDALCVRADHAICSSVGSDHADQQYAPHPAIFHADQSAALRDHDCPAGLSRGSRIHRPVSLFMANGADCRLHARNCHLDVPQQS